MSFHLRTLLTATALTFMAFAAAADPWTIEVADRRGAPLANVAVVIPDARPRAQAHGPARPTAVVDQRDERFIPSLLVVQTGTTVEFPNSDDVMHHVYSFSPAKRFEIPLYQHRPPSPVLFDRPGLVVLGCNIHDQMIGHILVVDTPYFGITDAHGIVRLDAEAPPAAAVMIWHPALGALDEAPRFALEPEITEIRLDVDARRLTRAPIHGALSWSDY